MRASASNTPSLPSPDRRVEVTRPSQNASILAAGPMRANSRPNSRQGGPEGGAARLSLRPLTGYEEELIAEQRSATNTARLCNEILARCTASPGEEPSDEQRFRVASLLTAERDLELLRLRRMSLGDHVETEVSCPACGQASEVSYSLDDLPTDLPPTPRQITVEVEEDCTATMRLPTAGDQADLIDDSAATEAELRSLLLGRVLIRYGDVESGFDLHFARSLSIPVRALLDRALDKVVPSLDLTMGITCSACRHEFTSPFDVTSFFLPS